MGMKRGEFLYLFTVGGGYTSAATVEMGLRVSNQAWWFGIRIIYRLIYLNA